MKQPRSRLTRVVTGAVVAALTTMGLVAMAPAASAADTPTTTAEITAVSAAGGVTVHVDGSNYVDLPTPTTGSPAAGVYAAIIDATTTTYDDLNANTMSAPVAVAFLPNATGPNQAWALQQDGTFSKDLVIPTDKINKKTELEVLVWVAHGNLTDDTRLFGQKLALSDAQLVELFGVVASPAKVLKSAKPGINGKAKVGKTLKAKVKKAKWTKGTKLTIKWYAAGKLIKKATDSKTLKLTKKYVGKKITVKVTGKKKGFDPVTVKAKTTKVKAKK